jgi:hypothetical protein
MRLAARALPLALAALGVCAPACKSDSPAKRIRFTDVADGVGYARLYRVPVGETKLDGHAFRVDLERAGLRVLAAGGPKVRRDVATIVRRFEDVVAVNGSFFDEEDKAMGLVVDQGRLISRWRKKSWGALVIKDSRARLVKGHEVHLEDNPELVLQGQPRLVVDGEVVELKPQEAARTAVCADGRYVTIVVLPDGTDATPLARLLQRPPESGGLGCFDALNLDGGPSTQLFARLGALSVKVKGGWGVPNALVALPGLPHMHVPPPKPDAGADGGAAAADAAAAAAAATTRP